MKLKTERELVEFGKKIAKYYDKGLFLKELEELEEDNLEFNKEKLD